MGIARDSDTFIVTLSDSVTTLAAFYFNAQTILTIWA
jgi:hypothetical protein